MNPDVEISIFDIFAESLAMMMKPAMEAIKLRRNLNIQSVEDIPLALQRAGYEISYVDLPVKVSGVALMIDAASNSYR
jgi:hypothetical protein